MKLMQFTIERKGQVGKIAEAFANLIQELPPNRYHATVKLETHKRSGAQNEYYWGVVLRTIALHTGQEAEVVHLQMRQMFLKRAESVRNKKGKLVRLDYVLSTTSLTTLEFNEYLRRIRQYAAEEHGLSIPEPREV